MPVAQLPVSYCTMKTTLVVSVFAACVAAILAQPLDQRFRRGIADPDVTFRENEIDSSLQELVRTKKSPKEKASELFIGKGIQKEVPQVAAIPSTSDKKEEEIASQVKTSLKDFESGKEGESAKDDADRSRRQQPFFVSPIALDGLAPNMLFRSSVESQLPTKSISQPAIVSPYLEQNDRSIAVPVRPVPVQIINTPDSTHLPHHHHQSSEPHGCTCQCATCRPQSSGLYTPLRASYGIEQQQSADDRVKLMRAAEQQSDIKQLQIQQQVQLLQQQMDQQRAVDQMQQLQLELQKQKLDEQQRSAADPSSLDPDCALNKLANLQLPKNILSELVQMEQQRVQKIKDCQGKTDQPQKLEFLSAIVEKEVELLQKQVELLQKSDAERKKKLDEKKTR